MNKETFTNIYPGEERITITAVGGKHRAKKATLKVFGRNSSREGVTKRQRQNCVISGTYPVKKIDVIRVGTQEEFEKSIQATAIELSREFNTQVWDESDEWGYALLEREPFNDPLPF